ncbi:MULTISPECIES: DUF6030 family protein [unclassified Ensifer]|uniref:DUF6030 family protein n=1 Tax=unclassified Ensifer TaxID=2633371 RepID=UPI000812F726|nr:MULTISPECIES: DUF6030 family protein [unclassified Ensifer]OCP11101.1 hypothetical protein BC362_01030 [Ensifer sp. LC14]OCP12727.1 hypothetical protein BC374_14135 [Ensifer sp. LC13]OCP13425.1 hypothetical protein BBX50_14530 [Ensifer sp. LC11]OCP34170.1 hypothetical protein BC364_12535 [Ensifer sp. LC499]
MSTARGKTPAGKPARRTGLRFFLIVLLLIVTAILATALLANGQRNLKKVLLALGLPTTLLEGEKPAEQKTARPTKRGPPLIALPAWTFQDLHTPEQQFLRAIRSDPKALCDELREAGFRELEWKSSAGERGQWECSSLISFPRPGEDRPSSIFIFVKGSGEEEITSFRVKLNIERQDDSQAVTTAAARAAAVFLDHVRWADAASVTLRIQALKEFDLKHFGSRIQFKRESDEMTPRYNFLANQPPRARPKSIAELYFDRSKWLASGDGSVRTFVRGPTAWNAPAKVPDSAGAGASGSNESEAPSPSGATP